MRAPVPKRPLRERLARKGSGRTGPASLMTIFIASILEFKRLFRPRAGGRGLDDTRRVALWVLRIDLVDEPGHVSVALGDERHAT